MSGPLQDLEQLLADEWEPIAPQRGYGFGSQKDIRAVQIRLELAQGLPDPLLAALTQLLFHEWDPLKVSHSAAALAEYDGYAFRIWVALWRGATLEQIEAYLNRVASTDMRAETAPGLNRAVAEAAVQLAAELRR
jgi:hypothetical protein